MSNTKKITIFNQRLCGYLMTKGFVLIGMSKGNHDKSKNVFFFSDSDELRKSIEEFKKLNIEK